MKNDRPCLYVLKTGIHPKYNEKAKVTCACGNTFEVGSTADYINVEICSNCIRSTPASRNWLTACDRAKRVDKFQARAKKAEATPVVRLKSQRSRTKSQTDSEKGQRPGLDIFLEGRFFYFPSTFPRLRGFFIW